MPTLPSRGFTACVTPMPKPVSPGAGKTIDRRAECGRPARPVRREGERNQSPLPTPIRATDVPLALDPRFRGGDSEDRGQAPDVCSTYGARIDGDQMAGDARRQVAGEEEGGAHDIRSRRHAAQSRIAVAAQSFLDRGTTLIGPPADAGKERRGRDGAGAECIDADAEAADIQRRGAHDAEHSVLARGVG